MSLFKAEQLVEFNDLDYGIYNFIIENPEKISYMTIRELADETHVSTATITRFCKKNGYNGFTEFKLMYKKEQRRTEKEIPDEDITVAESFFIRAKTKEFQENLNKAVELLLDSQLILCIGRGNSGGMAMYAARYFSSIGKFAVFIDNPMYQIKFDGSEKIACLIFSVSGNIILDNIPIIKQSKATILSITNSSNCPLAKISDQNIAYYVQQERGPMEDYEYTVDTTTQVPVVYLIEVLAKRVKNSLFP